MCHQFSGTAVHCLRDPTIREARLRLSASGATLRACGSLRRCRCGNVAIVRKWAGLHSGTLQPRNEGGGNSFPSSWGYNVVDVGSGNVCLSIRYDECIHVSNKLRSNHLKLAWRFEVEAWFAFFRGHQHIRWSCLNFRLWKLSRRLMARASLHPLETKLAFPHSRVILLPIKISQRFRCGSLLGRNMKIRLFLRRTAFVTGIVHFRANHFSEGYFPRTQWTESSFALRESWLCNSLLGVSTVCGREEKV